MDELRTNEGVLFRDEVAKKLFIDTKDWVLKCLLTSRKAFKDELYEKVLEKFQEWDDAAAESVMEKTMDYPDVTSRLQPSCVLYAKLLYGTYGGGGQPVTIRKPKLEILMRGMMTRVAALRSIQNSTFFDQDALRQDYAMRDIFRQALYDCIEIVEDADVEEPPREEEDVYPDDSISRVMENAFAVPVMPKFDSDAMTRVSGTSVKSVRQHKVPSEVKRITISNLDE